MYESFTIRSIIDSVNFHFMSTLISLYCITDVNRRNTTNFTIGWTTNGILLWCKLKSSTSEFLYSPAFLTNIPGYIFCVFSLCQLYFCLVVCPFSSLSLILHRQCLLLLYLVFGIVFCLSSAGKARQKADRVVFDCQERAFWIVHKPPVSGWHKLLVYSYFEDTIRRIHFLFSKLSPVTNSQCYGLRPGSSHWP